MLMDAVGEPLAPPYPRFISVLQLVRFFDCLGIALYAWACVVWTGGLAVWSSWRTALFTAGLALVAAGGMRTTTTATKMLTGSIVQNGRWSRAL